MRVGALIPMLVFVVIVGGVGCKTLALWRRTRELPEQALGVGLVSLALLGIPLSVVGRLPGHASQLTGRVSFALGMLAVCVGVSQLYRFTHLLFRRRSVRAQMIVGGCYGVIAVACGALIYLNFQGSNLAETMVRLRPWSLGIVCMVALCFAWNGCESILYYRALRRRLALGLADPILVNRFLLWGLSGIAAFGILSGIAACVYKEMVIMREVLPLSGMAVLGSVLSATWYLTFFAPQWYHDMVRGFGAKRSPV